MIPGAKCCGNCFWRRDGRCLSSPRNENRGKVTSADDGQDCAYWITEGASVAAEIERYLTWKGERGDEVPEVR